MELGKLLNEEMNAKQLTWSLANVGYSINVSSFPFIVSS